MGKVLRGEVTELREQADIGGFVYATLPFILGQTKDSEQRPIWFACTRGNILDNKRPRADYRD